jgi:hypothetical protein
MARRLIAPSIAGRSMALAAVAALALLVLTQVPLVPTDGPASGSTRLVPVDTWAGEQFPAVRDVYRHHLAILVSPSRLPLLALLVAVLAASAASYPRVLGTWLAARVPPLSAFALGMFRFAFGAAMLLAVIRETPPDAMPVEAQRAASWLARQSVIRQLAATPGAAVWLQHCASAGLAAFALGLWSRTALALAAVSLTLFMGVVLNHKGLHDWGVPLLTLWMLVLVPWHDSFGLQSVVARRRGVVPVPVSPRARGLALWLPSVTLGVAYAAAAFAKLDTSGLAWITGGAVRFHFLQDAPQAPVEWGLRVAGSDVAAVGLSFAAVVTEGSVWFAALTPSLLVRGLVGIAGIAMLTGFYLFQGVFWPAWWALLLVYLPWPFVDRLHMEHEGAATEPTGPAVATALSAGASAVVVALVAQQLLVSALRVESEPFLSDFSMYARTWPSKKAFSEQFGEKTTYEMSARGRSADEFHEWLRATPVFLDAMNEAAGRSMRGERWSDGTRTVVDAARRAYQAQFGEDLSQVHVRRLVLGFDWNRGAFDSRSRVLGEGLLELDTGRFIERGAAGR